MLSTCMSTRQFARPFSKMLNWVFVAALFAAVSAAPQSYIVGPGHFHYEFGGQNEFKYATPAPAVKAYPVTPVAPVVKKVDYQVNAVPYRAPVTVRPVTVSTYTAKPYTAQPYSAQPYSGQSYGQYPSQYSYPYGRVAPSAGVSVPQYNKVTVPQYNKVSVPVVPVATVRTQPATVPQVYSSQVQSGQNYGRYAILRYIVDIQPQGSYNYAYETENGIQAEESGVLKNGGSQDEAEVAQGYYSYTGPDGVVYTVRYIADENGFRAEGDHLPKIPEVIQRSLEYLRTLPPQPDEQK